MFVNPFHAIGALPRKVVGILETGDGPPTKGT